MVGLPVLKIFVVPRTDSLRVDSGKRKQPHPGPPLVGDSILNNIVLP